MVYNTGRDPIIMYVVQFDREFQPTLDHIGRLAQAELLMLMIKQQKKNLHVHVTANNEAIQAQQQLLQDLYPHWSAEFPDNQKLCCQQKGWQMVFASIREHAKHWDFFASTSRDKKLFSFASSKQFREYNSRAASTSYIFCFQ